MRDGWKSHWGLRISAIVMVGGLLALGTGTAVTQAGDQDDDHDRRNPFQQILHKLDKILDTIKGEGGQGGNHTLRWDTNHPSTSRFTTAFPGAVLDKNTGLVWEQAPDATERIWASATSYCVQKNVGGTVGWRLPSVVELKSVQDRSPGVVAPFVPASVFTGIQSTYYWSATTIADNPSFAWSVFFLGNDVSISGKTSIFPAWCVRGGMNADQY
jgi:hypothetical protein